MVDRPPGRLWWITRHAWGSLPVDRYLICTRRLRISLPNLYALSRTTSYNMHMAIHKLAPTSGTRALGTHPRAHAHSSTLSSYACTSAYATATPRATAAAACCRDITAHATLGTTWGTTVYAAASAELACAASRCGAARCPRGRPQACPEPELALARRLGSHLVHRSGATLPFSAQAARR